MFQDDGAKSHSFNTPSVLSCNEYVYLWVTWWGGEPWKTMYHVYNVLCTSVLCMLLSKVWYLSFRYSKMAVQSPTALTHHLCWVVMSTHYCGWLGEVVSSRLVQEVSHYMTSWAISTWTRHFRWLRWPSHINWSQSPQHGDSSILLVSETGGIEGGVGGGGGKTESGEGISELSVVDKMCGIECLMYINLIKFIYI